MIRSIVLILFSISSILIFVLMGYDCCGVGVVNAFTVAPSLSSSRRYSNVGVLTPRSSSSSSSSRQKASMRLQGTTGGGVNSGNRNSIHKQRPKLLLFASTITRPKIQSFKKFFVSSDSTSSGSSSSSSNNSSTTETVVDSDPVMREFQVKEAAIEKQLEKAAARLAEYETSLEKIRTRKQEYMAASQLPDSPLGGSFSETTIRSIVKSIVWRVVAGSITFMTTLKFSGSITQALQVVSADFFSKAFTMFLGERIMNKSQVGRTNKNRSDSAGRSLVKALIWRLFAVSNTLTMAIFISKDLSIASKIASTDAVFKTALMYFYERVWAKIDWGKEYLIEFSI